MGERLDRALTGCGALRIHPTRAACSAPRPARCRPTPSVPWKPVTGSDTSRKPEHGIEPLLSIEEVTGLLRISESGVYRLVRHGELPRVKVGNRTLFEPAEIRRFIARQREEQGNTTPGAQLLAALDLGASDG